MALTATPTRKRYALQRDTGEYFRHPDDANSQWTHVSAHAHLWVDQSACLDAAKVARQVWHEDVAVVELRC